MLRLKLAPDPFPDEMPYACQAARHPVVPVWNRLPQPGGFRRDRPPGAGLHS